MTVARVLWLIVTVSAATAACGGRTNLEGAGVYQEPDGSPADGSSPDGGPGSPHSGQSSRAGASSGSDGNGSGLGGSTSSSGGGGPSGQAGTLTTDPDPDPGNEPSPDPGNPNCTPSKAKGGNACTAPCVTTCGYYDMGTRACDCVSGVFVSCSCPRPWNYQGRTTAPPCDTPDGRTHWIDNNACAEEWAQCIGTDPVSGTNPRGCVCLTDPVNGKLEWTCGSTNRWFLSE